MSSTKYLKNFKRAAVCAALFFTSVGFSAATETYKDIIEKAYNLSLQKDRTQAVSILLAALKKEAKKSTAQRDLAQALKQVSTVFYSDKSLQLYELALSLRVTEPNLGVSKLQEALRLEPDNMSIEVALARMAIYQGDCSAALTRLSKKKELVSYNEELKLISSQANVCLGKFEDYLINRAEVDMKRSAFIVAWQLLEVEYLFKIGNFTKSREGALNILKSNSTFPETYYWLWKVETEMKLKTETSGQKYLNACKVMKERQARDYLFEPQLCHRMAEVESFLKKNNNSEI